MLASNCVPLSAVGGPMVESHGIVGCSRSVLDLIRRIELVAATRSTVLITGETGTGKELVARAMHHRSAQREMPFIKVNCAAIPETLLESELFGHVKGRVHRRRRHPRGKFALAHRGSIFLDEIGTMAAGLQAKLLRVLQERKSNRSARNGASEVDVRVIAATNRDLRQLVETDGFRTTCFTACTSCRSLCPPLRERVDDIPMLAATSSASTRRGARSRSMRSRTA